MDLGSGVRIELVSVAQAAGTLGGLVFGACMQRLAERSPPPGSWRRALPWLAALAVLLLLAVTTHVGALPVHVWAPFLAIYPIGAVALVQIAAAVAGRGRPAPLPRAAPWVRAVVLGALLLVPTVWGLDPVAFAAFTAITLAVAGIAWILRRPPRPGAVLTLWGVVQGPSFLACADLLESRHGESGLMLASQLVAIVSLPAVAASIRWCRLDRGRLAALGIDLYAPGEAAAAVLTAVTLATVLIVQYAAPAPGDHFEIYLRIMIAAQVITLALFFFALLYLRRVLDEAEARGRARAA